MTTSVGTLSIDFETNLATLSQQMARGTDAVVSGAQQMQRAAEIAKNSLEALGVSASFVGFVEMMRGAIEAAEHLENLRVATDLSVQDLAGLSLVAKQSGTDLDGLAKAVSRMSVEMGKSPEKFTALGVTAKDGSGALKQFADIFNDLTDVQQRNALAQAVFKKSWQEIAPVLSLGSAGIDEAMQKGIALSAVTQELTSGSKEFNDKWIELTGTGGFLNQQLGTILPLLNSIAGTMVELKGDSKQLGEEGFHPLAEMLKQIVLFAGNVAFVFHGVGVEIGAIAAQIAAGGPFTEAGRQIHQLAVKDAEDARAAFDRWEKQIQSTATSLQVVGDTSDALSRRLAVSHRAEQEDAAKRAKAFLDSQNAAQTATGAYDALIKRIQERIDTDSLQVRLGRELTEQEKFESKALTELAAILKQFPSLSRAYVEGKLAELKVDDLKSQQLKSQIEQAKQIAALRQSEKNTDYAQSAAGIQSITDAWAQQLKTVNDTITAQQAEMDAERLVVQLNISHAEAVELVTIARLKDEQTRTVVDGEAYKALQQQIEAHQKLLGVLNDDTAWKNQLDLMHQMEGLGKQLWDDLWSGGHDTLKRLGEDIKKFLLDELYQLVVKKWVINIAAQVTGGGGSISSLFGLGNGLTGGSSGSGSDGFSLAASGNSFNQAIGGGNPLASLFGGNAGLATAGQMFGIAAGGAMVANLIGSAIGLKGQQVTAATMGGALLGGIPGAIIGALVSPGGGPKIESGFGDGLGVNAGRGDPTAAQNVAVAIQAQYAAIAGALGQTNTTLSNLGVFLATDPKGTAQTQLDIHGGSFSRIATDGGLENVGRSDADLTNAIALASAQLILKNLQEQVTGPVGDYLKSIDITTASLADMSHALQVAQDVGTFDKAMQALGIDTAKLTSLTLEQKDAVVQALGGAQAFTTALASFYNDFTSDAEKQTLIWQGLVQTFTAANVVLPSTRDAFKAAVDTALAAGDSNSLKTLLGAEAAFNQLYPAIADAGAAAAETAAQTTAAADAWQRAYFQSWVVISKAASSNWSDAIRSTSDSFTQMLDALQAEVDKIRGAWVTDTTNLSLGSAQSTFNALLAEAKAGDMSAVKLLPGAAESLLTVAQTQAQDLGQLRVIQATTAQALLDAQSPVRAAYRDEMAALASEVWGTPYVAPTIASRTDATTAALHRVADRLEAVHTTLQKHTRPLDVMKEAFEGKGPGLKTRVLT